MKKKTLVLGLGNPLMGDEGIGTELIARLDQASENFPEADFIDAGTGGISLLTYFEQRDRVILIDCALMGSDPGTIRRFNAEDVVSVKKLSHLSLHEVDILNVIKIAKHLDQCPEDIIFFGVEPQVIADQMHLSKTVSSQIEHYITRIEQEIANS